MGGGRGTDRGEGAVAPLFKWRALIADGKPPGRYRRAAGNSPLSMSGQHNVGRDHEPKRIVAYKRNIDEYRNEREQGDNKRNDMDTENVEHCNAGGHVCLSPECFRERKSLLIRQELQSEIDDRSDFCTATAFEGQQADI
ncbi:MAG TPA: hypothetical protein VKT99_03990 [Xanthobacteraceae bacterium]|jgi:hypothetical protein|nr:hypothetical protein [Xanthobacteraceae bacterium]